ncbi:hypothetical protein D3C85_1710830 [compost metagenome]
MMKNGGIQAESIELRLYLSFFQPLTRHGIPVCTFQHKHAMLEHIEAIKRLGVGSRKIDIPLTINMMQLWRPN